MLTKSHAKMLARAGPILARLPIDAPFVIVEVGVNRGQLAEHLLRERPLLTWHGVDPWWDGPANSSDAYKRTADGHAIQPLFVSERCYRETKHRVAPFGARANVIRLPTLKAAEVLFSTPGSADGCFLDGDHSYEAVNADIEAWWPVVRSGGWLGGHDIFHKDPRFDFTGVDRAVKEFVVRTRLPLDVDVEEATGLVLGSCWFVRKP